MPILRSGTEIINHTTTMNTSNTLKPSDFPTTPFSGIIDLNTESGRKLYIRATAPLTSSEQQLSFTQTPYNQFMDHIKSDSKSFGYGDEIHAIPTSSNTTASIINNSNQLTLEHVQKAALVVWGDASANFSTPLPVSKTVQTLEPWNSTDHYNSHFLRIRSNMLAIRIKNILIHQDYNSLLSSKDKFIWRHPNGQDEYDGLIMLYLLLQKIKPSKLVLARKYKHNLRNATS